jgi:phage terminase large subunit GpA-like protein
MSAFAAALPIVASCAEAFRPPRLVRVSDGAARALMIRQPGGYSGPWSASEAPYMAEPMDMLASRQHQAVCFVGPSRSGKTMGLVDGAMAHFICHDSGDALILQMTQEKAREFSKTRIDRMIRHSPEVRSRMSMRRHDDNTHDKLTRSGMWIKIGWPSATQLSGSDYRYVLITDYDRMPDNIDGEGSGFVLSLKRTQTYMSRGMCLVESSPGRDYEDPHWRPETPHEPPPVTGVLGIYANSDRRRWYWQCFDCRSYFEAAPGLSLFATLPDEAELMEIVRAENLGRLAQQHAKVCCPHCGSQIEHQHKHELNSVETARWVPEGQTVDADGNLVGEARVSSIAGFWLGGVAAAYQSWESIILGHLQGLREYVMSGSDRTLKSKINTDQAMPYIPRGLIESTGDQAESRQVALERFHVPDWARFLLCSVDVQGGTRARFVVQVHAIGVDMQSAIVDRYDITESPRGENIRIDPASYPEDWEALTHRVINATYRIDEDRELQVYHTTVDYGGEDGVSVNAAAWRQRLRREGMANRVTLSKGDGALKEMVQQSNARDRRGKAMKDVPLLLFSADKFKDLIAASMRRRDPGPAYMHFPRWLKQWFFDELRAEVRQPNGKWKKIRARNESLDCWAMIWAQAYYLGPADPRRPFNWSNPPPWALPLDGGNSHVVSPGERRLAQTSRPVVASSKPKASGYIL